MGIFELLLGIASALGVWAHVNPHIKNTSSHKWLDLVLKVGNAFAGEYHNNKSHPSP